MDKKQVEILANKFKKAKIDLDNDSVQDIWDKLIESGQYVKTEDLLKNTNEK